MKINVKVEKKIEVKNNETHSKTQNKEEDINKDQTTVKSQCDEVELRKVQSNIEDIDTDEIEKDKKLPENKCKEELITESNEVNNNFVIVKYEDQFFPGIITNRKKNKVLVNAIESCGKDWRWPERKDEI